jgi:hypothetical protein
VFRQRLARVEASWAERLAGPTAWSTIPVDVSFGTVSAAHLRHRGAGRAVIFGIEFRLPNRTLHMRSGGQISRRFLPVSEPICASRAGATLHFAMISIRRGSKPRASQRGRNKLGLGGPNSFFRGDRTPRHASFGGGEGCRAISQSQTKLHYTSAVPLWLE